MRVPLLLTLAALLAAGFGACKKDAVYQIIHADTIITGNNPPNYTGVPTLNIRLYVNRMHVDLLGREATGAELQSYTNLLVNQDLSQQARAEVATLLLNDTAYYQRLTDLASADFIDGNGAAQAQQKVLEYTYLYAYADSLGDELLKLFFSTELNRLNVWLSTKADYAGGTITINEFYRRFLDNFFYDQLNMGSENFVKATFDDLFRRAPTDAELANGVTMVDGLPAVLLLSDGSNKADFMNIATQSNEFYEGLARKTYLQLLQREPDTQEIGAAVLLVKPAGDYKALQIQIVTSTEYAGF